jgi:hypothetical protein
MGPRVLVSSEKEFKDGYRGEEQVYKCKAK